MKRKTHWFNRWASFLTGVCIGLLIVAPVLAMPKMPYADGAWSPLLLDPALIQVAALLLTVSLMQRIGAHRVRRRTTRR